LATVTVSNGKLLVHRYGRNFGQITVGTAAAIRHAEQAE
jgi:hypothetical protein